MQARNDDDDDECLIHSVLSGVHLLVNNPDAAILKTIFCESFREHSLGITP